MRSAHDEWGRAQLRLRLRAATLFHGESAELLIDAHVPDTPPDALPALRQRWQTLCDGARVDVRIMDADALPHAPPLCRQDARLTVAATAADAHNTLTLRCDVLVRVRSEFWGRPLLLRVRVTPPASSDGGAGDALRLGREPLEPALRLADPLQHSLVLRLIREEPAAAEPLVRSLEREIRVSKPLQLRAETRYMGGERVCIVARVANTDPSVELKLLDLQLHLSESYSLPAAETSNSENKARTRGSRQQQQGAMRAQAASRRGRPTRQFRVANDALGQLPVILRGAEQFNFLFVLEAVDGRREDAAAGDEEEDEEQWGDCDDATVSGGGEGDAQDRAASMSTNDRGAASEGMGKRRNSSGNVIASTSTTTATGGAAAARSAKRVGTAQTHQTLLTLSWEASTPAGARLAPPITEHHTIIWSPQSSSAQPPSKPAAAAKTPQQHPVRSSSPLLLPASAFTSLVSAPSTSSAAAGGVRTVRLDAQRALSLSLAALPQHMRVGEVVTLCLVIANRSAHASFDLTLLAPFVQTTTAVTSGVSTTAAAAASTDDASWFGFEATHRLGVVAPGMTVRKSVRAVALRFGKCDLNRFALFDRLSRTCFLPPTAASARSATVPSTSSTAALSTSAAATAPSKSPSSSSSWEVIIVN